jgi:hypothetical protein
MTTQGIMQWTVPTTGMYTITAAGGLGAGLGVGSDNVSNNPAYGALLSGTFTFTAGQVIAIVVGQRASYKTAGNDANWGGAGGGGTFIFDNSTKTLYMTAAGGAGCAINNVVGTNVLADTYARACENSTSGGRFNYTHDGGTFDSQWVATGGADGSVFNSTTLSSQVFNSNFSARGWNSMSTSLAFGPSISNPNGVSVPGFGGGGTSLDHNGGGGGGYSGGNALNYNLFGSTLSRSGGGSGGSYNAGTSPSFTSSSGSASGYVTITKI